MTLTKTLADFAIVGTPENGSKKSRLHKNEVKRGWKHHYMYNFRYLIALHAEFVICRKTLSWWVGVDGKQRDETIRVTFGLLILGSKAEM